MTKGLKLENSTTEQWEIERYRGDSLEQVVSEIRNDKKTGSLTINFSQGGVGQLEWKQRSTPTNGNRHVTGM